MPQDRFAPRHLQTSLLVAFSLCLANPTQARERPGPATPKSITLRFAWPATFEADVDYAGTRFDPERPATTIGPFHARLSATTTGDEIRIALRSWSGGPGSDPRGVALLQATEPVIPVIDRKSGGVVRVDGTAAAEDAMRRSPVLATFPERSRDSMIQIVPAAADRDARDTWGSIVSAWAGKELSVGVDHVAHVVSPVPAVEGESIRVDVQLRYERVLECPGAPSRKCVELRGRSVPNAEDAERIIDGFKKKLGIPRAPSSLTELKTITDVVLVTEPDGLVPHRVEIRKTSAGGAGKGVGAERRDAVRVSTWTFRYTGKPASPR